MQDERSRDEHQELAEGGSHSPPVGKSGQSEADAAPESEEALDPEFAPPEFVELSPEEAEREALLCRETLRRIERMIGIAGAACALAVVRPLGWAFAGGVLIGTLLSWINFRWLAATVNAIGERVVKAKSQERGTAVVARGVGRIGLIALVAYGIFECSVRGLMGFLAGLAMPVIAMTCEAVYEIVVSRGPRQA